jgi:NADH dehydrogenase
MPFPEDLAVKAEHALARLGVEVRVGVMVQQIDKEGLTVESSGRATRITARTVIWAGGVTMTPLAKTIGNRTSAPADAMGRIKVNPDLTVPGYPDFYVIGDLASAAGTDGKPLPGVAPVAMQQGAYAARVIARRARGNMTPPAPFKYVDKGNLAVIGRAAAVANVFGRHIWGLPAWLIWAFIHLLQIVQAESRLVVFIRWAIQYLTFNRSARLITGSASTDLDFSSEANWDNPISQDLGASNQPAPRDPKMPDG